MAPAPNQAIPKVEDKDKNKQDDKDKQDEKDKEDEMEKDKGDQKKDNEEVSVGGRVAKLVVVLPGDARLFIDNQLMKATSARRVFRTPALQQGQVYYYILRAEMVRDGKKHTQTRRVIVQAGDQVRARFNEPKTAVAVKIR